MTRGEIDEILNREPHLNDFGFGVYEGRKNLSREECEEELRANREILRGRSGMCSRACGWLEDKREIKSFNLDWSSYRLKHLVEKEIGDITNGAFIVATIHMGFKLRKERGGPNAYFNISKRSLEI